MVKTQLPQSTICSIQIPMAIGAAPTTYKGRNRSVQRYHASVAAVMKYVRGMVHQKKTSCALIRRAWESRYLASGAEEGRLTVAALMMERTKMRVLVTTRREDVMGVAFESQFGFVHGSRSFHCGKFM